MRYAIFLVAAYVLGAGPAYAYIDPNAGGWLYQMLFPLLIALAGAFAVLREKVRAYLSALAEKFRRKPR
ncbi:MAG TPA: hypothetical protein VFI86_00545 [Burkholderiales bacterium]|nr:hypothetical protein [Burkholderiales bacterium]